jgi:hypothetical protein
MTMPAPTMVTHLPTPGGRRSSPRGFWRCCRRCVLAAASQHGGGCCIAVGGVAAVVCGGSGSSAHGGAAWAVASVAGGLHAPIAGAGVVDSRCCRLREGCYRRFVRARDLSFSSSSWGCWPGVGLSSSRSLFIFFRSYDHSHRWFQRLSASRWRRCSRGALPAPCTCAAPALSRGRDNDVAFVTA